MGTIRLASLLTILAVVQPQLTVSQAYECPITKAPVERFIPPLPWKPIAVPESPNDPRSNTFLLGTPGLWAYVTNHWTLGRDQNKLAYFSERYDWKKAADPPLAVVARRLDAPAPLVWARWVNGAGPSYNPSEGLDPSRRDGFMVTSLEIPSKGCWEISAHFTDVRDKVETVTYVTRVE
jgi:hypothetical protein